MTSSSFLVLIAFHMVSFVIGIEHLNPSFYVECASNDDCIVTCTENCAYIEIYCNDSPNCFIQCSSNADCTELHIYSNLINNFKFECIDNAACFYPIINIKLSSNNDNNLNTSIITYNCSTTHNNSCTYGQVVIETIENYVNISQINNIEPSYQLNINCDGFRVCEDSMFLVSPFINNIDLVCNGELACEWGEIFISSYNELYNYSHNQQLIYYDNLTTIFNYSNVNITLYAGCGAFEIYAENARFLEVNYIQKDLNNPETFAFWNMISCPIYSIVSINNNINCIIRSNDNFLNNTEFYALFGFDQLTFYGITDTESNGNTVACNFEENRMYGSHCNLYSDTQCSNSNCNDLIINSLLNVNDYQIISWFWGGNQYNNIICRDESDDVNLFKNGCYISFAKNIANPIQYIQCPINKECYLFIHSSAAKHVVLNATYSTELTITDSYKSLQNSIILLPMNGNFNMKRVGSASLANSTIYGNITRNIHIRCYKKQSCSYLTVYAQNTMSIYFDCIGSGGREGNCNYMTLYVSYTSFMFNGIDLPINITWNCGNVDDCNGAKIIDIHGTYICEFKSIWNCTLIPITSTTLSPITSTAISTAISTASSITTSIHTPSTTIEIMIGTTMETINVFESTVNNSKNASSDGIMLYVIVGIIAFILLIGVLTFFTLYQKKNKQLKQATRQLEKETKSSITRYNDDNDKQQYHVPKNVANDNKDYHGSDSDELYENEGRREPITDGNAVTKNSPIGDNNNQYEQRNSADELYDKPDKTMGNHDTPHTSTTTGGYV